VMEGPPVVMCSSASAEDAVSGASAGGAVSGASAGGAVSGAAQACRRAGDVEEASSTSSLLAL
jgi:hypothetical protein